MLQRKHRVSASSLTALIRYVYSYSSLKISYKSIIKLTVFVNTHDIMSMLMPSVDLYSAITQSP